VSQPSASPQTLDSLRIADARWRAVIDAAVDGIIVIDSRGKIEAFNAAAERISATPKLTSSTRTSAC